MIPARADPTPPRARSEGSSLARGYVAAVAFLCRAFGVVSAALFAAAMLVICHMVVIRYLFRSPTIWHTDFAVYSATAAVFLGAPYVLLMRGHVGVDVVETLVPAWTRPILRTCGNFFALTFCVAMLVASALFAYEAWTEGWRTSGVWQIPLWIPSLPLPVGFAVLTLQYVAEFLRPDPRSAP